MATTAAAVTTMVTKRATASAALEPECAAEAIDDAAGRSRARHMAATGIHEPASLLPNLQANIWFEQAKRSREQVGWTASAKK